jgi:hypothetical protein
MQNPRNDGFNEPSGERCAIQTLRAWERVRRHIEERIPRNLANADDPQVVFGLDGGEDERASADPGCPRRGHAHALVGTCGWNYRASALG